MGKSMSVDLFWAAKPLTPAERRQTLVMRPWRQDERRIVTRGFLGRLVVAVEPALLALLFAAFAMLLAHGNNRDHRLFLAPLFALGAAAFTVYAIAIMVRPIRALLETSKPIFVVDGFLRTRGRDDFSETGSNGYVAVLLPDHRVACEWPTVGEGDLPMAMHPAYVEFSEYGGVHVIDGRSTGVLPDNFPAFGIGGNRPPRR
jgi:hypothetical protein